MNATEANANALVNHLAKVRVASSNLVVRSKEPLVRGHKPPAGGSFAFRGVCPVCPWGG